MQVISVRNVHEALPRALQMLDESGLRRESRNGPVLHYPVPVSTVYSNPTERVVFWHQRDYNIAFALYEALWMLAGRNDLEPLLRYVKTFGDFSDDGRTLHGAYGKRWRRHFMGGQLDQLEVIIDSLRENPNDRRCVLQMWDAEVDLLCNWVDPAANPKDIPCNDMATFQRTADGSLDLVVFCRSNDILWGAYYANAFHFSFLQEYMAAKIGCPVGTYTQVSVNWHGYLKTLETVKDIPRPNPYHYFDNNYNPYRDGKVRVLPLEGDLDSQINSLLYEADTGAFGRPYQTEWAKAAQAVLWAHHLWRTGEGLSGSVSLTESHPRFEAPLALLDTLDVPRGADWTTSMRQWLLRREEKWRQKNR